MLKPSEANGEEGKSRMRLYDKLVQRKRNGQVLDMKQVTYETLYQLWWKEECTDDMIADLYAVTKKKITNLRHKWEVKVPETIVKEFQEKFTGTIPTASDPIRPKGISPDGAALLRKIHNLNDLELESLRLELSRRYTIFSEVKQEVEFLAAVEQAVRSFGVASAH